MAVNIMRIADMPAEEAGDHHGFIYRTLLNLPEKEVSIRFITVEPGGKGPIPAHRHSGGHLFYVIEGNLELEMAGKIHVVPSGCCVQISAETVHQLRCADDIAMTVLAVKWK